MEVVSSWLMNYYTFLKEFHREPLDWQDMYDGIDVFIELEKMKLPG